MISSIRPPVEHVGNVKRCCYTARAQHGRSGAADRENIDETGQRRRVEGVRTRETEVEGRRGGGGTHPRRFGKNVVKLENEKTASVFRRTAREEDELQAVTPPYLLLSIG